MIIIIGALSHVRKYKKRGQIAQIKKEKKLMIMVNDVSQYDILMNFIEDNFFDKDNFFVIISKTFS